MMPPRPLYAALATLALTSPANPAWGACKLGILAELPVTMRGLRPLVTAKINGTEALFIADSGAFFSMITPSAAEQFKLRLEPAPVVMTGVGGESRTLLTTVKTFTLLDVPLSNVEFLVAGNELEGAAGMLGQNVFRIADVEYDLANGAIRLIRPHDCRHTELAYWIKDPGLTYSVVDIDWATAQQPHTTGTAYVNGAKIRVMYDTGASTSVLTLAAAARAGVKPGGEGVVEGGTGWGVGRSVVKTWIAPFASFKIGQEEIRNTRLRIGSLGLLNTDMLLGSDFFLSHRVYVASSQHKLYFTYNGGPVFNLEAAPPAHPPSGGTAAEDKSAEPAQEPADAEAFSRRGTAFASRHDYEHAIADLTRACELAPNEPRYLYERGLVHWAQNQPEEAAADFDQALKLKSDDVPVLVARARLRLQRGARAGAIADLDAADPLAPASDDIRIHMGQLYLHADQLAQAIAQYDKWITAHDRDVQIPAARNERCWARALLGQELDKALADCNAAVKSRPDDPVYLDSRGLVRLRMGDYSRSIADYDAALKLQPHNAWSLLGRGLAKLHKGQSADGEADLAAAAALNPHIAETAAKYHVTR